jgi:hypothetical protein
VNQAQRICPWLGYQVAHQTSPFQQVWSHPHRQVAERKGKQMVIRLLRRLHYQSLRQIHTHYGVLRLWPLDYMDQIEFGKINWVHPKF